MVIRPLTLLLICLLISTTYSVCTSSQYLANGVCNDCDVTCKTCTSSAATSCLTCDSTRFLTSFSSCYCSDGKVEKNPVEAACQTLTCHYSCVTCNNTVTQCTSCSSANKRVFLSNNHTCPCIERYFDDGSSASCGTCHYTCTTCSGTAETKCLTCNIANAHRSHSGTSGTDGSCPCIDKFYDITNTYHCAACEHQCKTCLGTTANCTTCGANRGASPGCLCNEGYYDDGVTQACIICHYSCQNCTNGTSCNKCDASKERELSSLSPLCSCKDRFFDNSVLQCSACNPLCFTCSSTNVCLTCNQTAYREHHSATKTCLCMEGYFQTSTTVEHCSTCDSRCQACQGTSTNCTLCSASNNRILTSNACPCKDYFYQNSFILCAACHSSCFTCTNPNECVTCVPSTLMIINSSNLCACPSDKFWNATSNVCQGCDHSCATCDPSSQTMCVTCPSSSFRTLASNACPCDMYYYNSGTNPICQRCHHSCQTCSTGTASTCLTCTDAKHRYFDASQCLCKALFYDNGAVQLCQPCLYHCLTCVDPTSCQTCNSTLFRQLYTHVTPNVCGCIKYYFQHNSTCQECLYSCDTCNTFTTCLTCDSATNHRVYNGSTLLCDCQPGWYDNFVDRTCLICLPQCYTCTNATTCTSCNASRFRALTSTNMCPCIDQYFDVNGQCTGCLYHCQTCTNPTTCSTCNSTAFRKLNAGSLCICADNYFDDGSNQLCLPCSYACLTCVGTAIQCVTCDTSQRSMVLGWCACPQYFYDNNNTVACPKCHYTCDSCLAGHQCTTCSAVKYREWDSVNRYCICSLGYYDDTQNELCPACNYRCYTCTNSTQCLTCSPAWFRATPASMCPCADGYYDDGSTPTCVACHYTCKTCTNGSQCLTCDLTTNKRVFDSAYLCKCIDKFYDDTFDNQLCLACVYSCKTCSKITSNCTSCNATAQREMSSTSCVCKQRWFDNLVEQCVRCHYQCSTCIRADQCSSCDAAKQRVADSTNNLCKCNPMFWDDGALQDCQACESTCYTCLDLTNCTSCNVTRNRLLNSTANFFNVSSPFCVCLFKYYSPATNQDCLPCHYSCQVCTGGNRNQCADCAAHYQRFLDTNVTQCKCLDGYYDDNITQPCKTCHAACAICHTGLTNSCIKCNDPWFLLLNHTTCYDTCPDFYFDYQVNFTCQSCSQWCQKCVNQSYCSLCQSGKLLYQNQCYQTCPGGTYVHNNTICLDCPKGCYSCSGNSYCSSCYSKYYYNNVLNYCFSCNSVCLNCTGPGQKDCTSCQSPLIVYGGTCTVLECPVGTYVQPQTGCTSCSSKFAGASLCNYTQPLKCQGVYKYNGSACLHCNTLSGYQLNSFGQCGQICGDGVVIYLQCDDGNTLDGDGCSSKCTIEPGWNCSYGANASYCQLLVPPSVSDWKIVKKFGSNIVQIILVLSRAVRIDTSRFLVDISSLNNTHFNYFVQQNSRNLSLITITINYYQHLQGKQLSLTYSSARRLQVGNYPGRQLGVITFSSSFDLSSYPPANYYPDSTIARFQLLKQYISALSIAILILCFILVPKRMHLHAVTMMYIPAQIYITYGILPAVYTDWIQHTLKDLYRGAMFGGFSMGQCCQIVNQDHNLTTQITQNSGIIVFVLIGAVVFLVCMHLFDSYCYNIEEKLKMMRYFVFTLALVTMFSLIFNSMNGLWYYILQSKTDTFNTILSIFLNLLFIISLATIWVRTYQLTSEQLPASSIPPSAKVHSIDKLQENVIIPVPLTSQENGDKMSVREKESFDGMEDLQSEVETKMRNTQSNMSNVSKTSQLREVHNNQHQPLVWDYFSLYEHFKEKKKDMTTAKYFLPIFLTKLYLTAVLASLMQAVPFAFIITSGIVQAAFLVYLLQARPFKSTFTNFRLIVLSLIIVGADVVFSIYLKLSMDNNYVMVFQEIVVYLVLALLALTVIFAFCEHILAWSRQIWKKVFEPCLKGTRLMGTRNVPVYEVEVESSDGIDRSSFKMSGSSFRTTKRVEDNQQMDAFYARMLKKENLKNKYKRERMLR